MTENNRLPKEVAQSGIFNLEKARSSRKTAKEMLDKIYKSREGKQFKLVPKGPNTWVEVEVKPNKKDI